METLQSTVSSSSGCHQHASREQGGIAHSLIVISLIHHLNYILLNRDIFCIAGSLLRKEITFINLGAGFRLDDPPENNANMAQVFSLDVCCCHVAGPTVVAPISPPIQYRNFLSSSAKLLHTGSWLGATTWWCNVFFVNNKQFHL